jgi:carbon-monoxide dehydrogenase small subunit
MEGKPVLACLVLAMDARNKEITTIEGLAEDGTLHPLQKAFVDHGAVQCGFCTPGLIMTAKGLLDRKSHPSEEEVRVAIAGNLCRCTGYTKIVEAIMAVGKAS